MSHKYCPVQLVQRLFDKIRETKQAYTKHVVRLVPLQLTSFPRAAGMEEALARLVTRQFPAYAAHYPNLYHPDNFKKKLFPKPVSTGGEEGGADGSAAVVADADAAVEPAAKSEEEENGQVSAKRPRLNSSEAEVVAVDGAVPKQEDSVDADGPAAPSHPAPATPFAHSGPCTIYGIFFKARNCNTLTKNEAHQVCYKLMPKDGVSRAHYKDPKVSAIYAEPL
jgi:hypothetical protein